MQLSRPNLERASEHNLTGTGSNSGLRGYRPKQAHRKALFRRVTSRKAVKMTPQTVSYVESHIRLEHSPEQIARRMKFDLNCHGPSVSRERIYQHIWQDRTNGGSFYQHLRIVVSTEH